MSRADDNAMLVGCARVVTRMQKAGFGSAILAGILRAACDTPGRAYIALQGWAEARGMRAKTEAATALLELAGPLWPRGGAEDDTRELGHECALNLERPADDPRSVACLAVWLLATGAERAAYHRHVCLGGNAVADHRVTSVMQSRIEHVLTSVERKLGREKESESNGHQNDRARDHE